MMEERVPSIHRASTGLPWARVALLRSTQKNTARPLRDMRGHWPKQTQYAMGSAPSATERTDLTSRTTTQSVKSP